MSNTPDVTGPYNLPDEVKQFLDKHSLAIKVITPGSKNIPSEVRQSLPASSCFYASIPGLSVVSKRAGEYVAVRGVMGRGETIQLAVNRVVAEILGKEVVLNSAMSDDDIILGPRLSPLPGLSFE